MITLPNDLVEGNIKFQKKKKNRTGLNALGRWLSYRPTPVVIFLGGGASSAQIANHVI
jgi:hypothetical protein